MWYSSWSVYVCLLAISWCLYFAERWLFISSKNREVKRNWGHLTETQNWCKYQTRSCVCVCVLHHVWLFATPWTVAHQASLCMKFSGQEYWSRLPFPPLGDLPHPGIKPLSPALASRFLTHWATLEAPSNKVRLSQMHIQGAVPQGQDRSEAEQGRSSKAQRAEGLRGGACLSCQSRRSSQGRGSWPFSSTKANVCVCVRARGAVCGCVL